MNFGKARASRLTAADRRGWSVVPRTRLYRRGVAGAAAAMLVSVALLAQTSVTSEATWNDAEWGHGGAVGSVSCDEADGAFATRGEGRALSGAVAGTDLDAVAEVTGVEVTNDGTRARSDRGVHPPGEDSAANPLDVEALSALDLPLTDILALGLDTPTGVVNQYGEAQTAGEATGASGYVTDSGGINLDGDEGGYPELGSVSMENLLNATGQDLGTVAANVTDVEVGVGAVAGRATLDACANAWAVPDATESVAVQSLSHTRQALQTQLAATEIVEGLDRDYLASSLDMTVRTPAVGALLEETESTVDSLETTVNGLASNSGVLDSIVGGVTGLLNGLISNPILSLGNVSATLTASVDTSSVRRLIAEPFQDPAGLLTVHPADGSVTIDTAALLASAYPLEHSKGLNGLPPNTDLLEDPEIATTLSSALGSALEAWTTRVSDALDATIDAVSVNARVVIALKVQVCVLVCTNLDIGTITATVGNSLGALLAGDTAATVTTDLNLGVLGAVLRPVVNALVNTLIGGLTSGLGGIVGSAVEGVLGALRTLPSSIVGLTTPIVTAVSDVYSGLFLSGIVQVTANAQNQPIGGGPAPREWANLTPGRYDVAALRIEALGVAGANSLRLYLGRASVGPGCSISAARQEGSPCATY